MGFIGNSEELEEITLVPPEELEAPAPAELPVTVPVAVPA